MWLIISHKTSAHLQKTQGIFCAFITVFLSEIFPQESSFLEGTQLKWYLHKANRTFQSYLAEIIQPSCNLKGLESTEIISSGDVSLERFRIRKLYTWSF